MKALFCCLTLLLSTSTLYAVPDIDVAPLQYDFGSLDVGLTQTCSITVRNAGDTTLAITGIAICPLGSPDFALTTAVYLPWYWSPRFAYTFTVAWTPTGGGPNAAILEITSSDPDEPVVQVLLTGTGIPDYVEPAEQIVQLVGFTEQAVADGQLYGAGNGNSASGRLKAFQNMLDEAAFLIANEAWDDAIDVLTTALAHADGRNKPPDFIEGPAAAEVADRISALLQALN